MSNRTSRAAVRLRRLNGWLTIFWLLMLPVSLLTGLKNSLPFIVGVSVYALLATHFGAWIASRAEVASEENP